MNDRTEFDKEDDLDTITPKVGPAPEAEEITVKAASDADLPDVDKPTPSKAVAVKASVGTVERIMPIACTNIEEAYRTAMMFCRGGLVPRSFEIKGGNGTDWKATASRMAVAIMAGSEVGFGPASSLKNIFVINGLPTIFGQGAKALVQHSGTVEWEKKEATGSWEQGDYKITVTIKRRGQETPYTATFGKQDATNAGLLGRAKAGSPWKSYPERQAYWRAWTWAARDGFSDALMGLTIAEELEDFSQIEAARAPVDTSDLDDVPKQIVKGETHAAK